MKDLSNVEIKQGDIVYYFDTDAGDLQFAEVLETAENSVVVAQLELVEDTFGQQEFHRLPFGSVTTSSPMIFVLPEASQRLPIKEFEAGLVH